MAGIGSRISAFLEERVRLQPLANSPSACHAHPDADGMRVAVIGGGLAGPAFARRMLTLAGELGVKIRLDLLTRPSCNYCAGLITDLSHQTMQGLYGLSVPSGVAKESITEVIYMNRHSSVKVPLAQPLISILRTSRFKQQGFDEWWLQSIVKGLRKSSAFTLHCDAKVSSVARKEDGCGFSVTYDQGGNHRALDADVVVLATGLKSIQGSFMQGFARDFGYRPPPLMDACVTELNTSGAAHYDLDGRVLVVDGIIPNCIVALIPKGRDWLTVTGLGKVLADHDLEMVFNIPEVRRYIELDGVIDRLRCRKICSASVTSGPSRKFYGDGWVMIGDLTGYGRALKDGYFAAMQSADLAVRTLLLHGYSEDALRRNYARPLMRLAIDNRVGMGMFSLDQRFSRGQLGTLILKAAQSETRVDQHGGLVMAAFRALFSGELSYKLISALFVVGTFLHIITPRKN